MKDYLEGGLKNKYVIAKTDGSPVAPEAEYFVLRIDADPHARRALAHYADSVAADNLQLAREIREWLERTEGLFAQRGAV